jgi:hypothetical protein
MKELSGEGERMRPSGSISGFPALQVESLAVIAGGLKCSDDGLLVAVDEQSRSQLVRQLNDLGKNPRPNARLLRWFFGAGSQRTIFPASDVKVAAWVDNTLLTNPNLTEEWVRNALLFLPDHPLLHISLAGFETDPKRADFLRSFGMARLPKDSVVCTRAAEMLLAQHVPELALAAVDSALRTDPEEPAAQRLRGKILDAMPR